MASLAETSVVLVWAKWIPVLPFLAMGLCALLGCFRSPQLRKATGPIMVGATLLGFVMSLVLYWKVGPDFEGQSVTLFHWIEIGAFEGGNFSYYIDPLTVIMLLVVTGIGSLISIYAMGYMDGDPGYSRFFTYMALFLFAMTNLVMADNLLLLYLGWEGVGLASYLLIGFYYRKPSAANAAKKAFIVNRVGDFGFALGVMAVYLVFGAIDYATLLGGAETTGQVQRLLESARESGLSTAVQEASYLSTPSVTLLLAIPFLLMLGAFGKSAQLPLHVWLPDAMEGPTPVSALIHAATMVTAGVYMIARLIPLFQLNETALAVVATIGAVTALMAATIALCQYDIKRIWAYSTISQLGYMFLGVGVLGTTGAIFHLYTHAFFKALLFLTAGSVMHAMAGQLDLRKMSGLRKKMPVTAWLMFAGCLGLAGVPFVSAGYYSKDLILADALVQRPLLGWLGLVTALITAFYTFRLWFRVFLGPVHHEMGREHHGYEVEEGHEHELPHEPHEAPWWPMNAPLVLLAVGAVVAGAACEHWFTGGGHESGMMTGATTAAVSEETKAHQVGMDVEAYHTAHDHAHTVASLVGGVGVLLAIALAAYFHWLRRDATERAAGRLRLLVTLLYRKYYIDELYERAIRLPLRLLAYLCFLFDRLVVDGLVAGVAWVPRGIARGVQPVQRGELQGYATSMAVGLALVVAAVTWWVLM